MQPQQTEPQGIFEYYQILNRHKWAVISFLLIAILVGLWHNSKLVPIYSTTTTMIIDREARAPLPGQDRFYESYLSETLTFKTHFEMITSLPVLKRVVKDLGLDKKDIQRQQEEAEKIFPFRQYIKTLKKNLKAILERIVPASEPSTISEVTTVIQDPVEMIAKSLKGTINVQPVEETRLFLISVTHTDPVMARDIANGLANAYIEFNIESRMKASQNTLAWLQENLAEMKRNLEKAEEEFTSFKQREQLLSIEKSQEMITDKISDFNETYIGARNRRVEIETKLDKLTQMKKSGMDITQLRSLVSNPLIDSLYTELLSAEAELSKMRNIYKEKHPVIVQLQTKIRDTKNTILDEINKEIYKLDTERSVLIAKEKMLQDTISDFKNEAAETGKKELSHNILQRNVEMNQRLYDALLTSLKETDLAQNLDVSNIRILENAALSKAPIGPDKRKNIIVSIIIGLMLGVGYSFFFEFMDRSFKTEEDVQRYLNIAVLGIIPKVDRKHR